uniref:GLI pathogenesis-related 2 n=1 Tax=Rattus norvegicus TaxID=10116 RepID=F1M5V2_RAT
LARLRLQQPLPYKAGPGGARGVAVAAPAPPGPGQLLRPATLRSAAEPQRSRGAHTAGHGQIRYSEALASTRILKHSPESSRGQCGENLAWASYDQTGKEVADRWYSEIKSYNFQQPGFTSGTGHFTAMVWKNTKKIGVGKASASDGSSFVVARYFPAGNIVNQGFFEENVPPPKK